MRYLAAIHFQHVRQYRIHKAMPLCNVAYAYISANKPEQAWVPALLGMAEDAMTTGNPTETASFQNLLAAGCRELPARSLAELFISLTRLCGLFPLYPEIVLDSAIREDPIASLDWVKTMRIMAAEFTPAPSSHRGKTDGGSARSAFVDELEAERSWRTLKNRLLPQLLQQLLQSPRRVVNS